MKANLKDTPLKAILAELARRLEGERFFGEVVATFHAGRCDVVKTVKKTRLDQVEQQSGPLKIGMRPRNWRI